jgi:hypothetical protein
MGEVSEVDDFKMPKLVLCPVQLRTMDNTQAHSPQKPAFGTQVNKPESRIIFLVFMPRDEAHY